jgi:hypothetical protein
MGVNFRGRDAQRLVKGLLAKLTRGSVEHGNFLGRLDGHAFRGFSRLRWRNEDSFL